MNIHKSRITITNQKSVGRYVSAIKIENLSKQYRLGLVSTRTLSHDLNRWWQMNIKGKEDPYLRIGDTNIRAEKGDSEYVWALKDINLEVEEGEVLGIIGKNGAGKSTLLKILSKVTAPTTGIIKARGRIASLLEVGTGFHAEMTGRENIYLNGAILGMTKSEIRSKLDEIVDFAGVERYIDTPVKRYSSGMMVRLGFAVAAHLEPEILIVDEVLAVGDAEFQKKAIGKMQEVSQNFGRTVLFVSHNLGVVKTLCKNCVLLNNGEIYFKGEVEETLSRYLQSEHKEGISLSERTDRFGNRKLLFTGVEFLDEKDNTVNSVITGAYLKVKLTFNLQQNIDFSKMIMVVNFKDEYWNVIVSLPSDEMQTDFAANKTNQCFLEIPELLLRGGTYNIRLFASYQDTRTENICDSIENAASLHVISSDFWKTGKVIRSDRSAIFSAKYFN